jgi:hypothetical protein
MNFILGYTPQPYAIHTSVQTSRTLAMMLLTITMMITVIMMVLKIQDDETGKKVARY